MYVKYGLFLLLLMSSLHVAAQRNLKHDFNINLYLEELFTTPEEDLNYEELYETFMLLYQNPLQLNKANKAELQSLFLLTELQINNFLEYTSNNGPLISIYELQAIPGFDLHTIYKIIPFVTVQDPGLQYDPEPLLQRILNERNNMFILRYERTLEDKKGYLIADTLSDKNQNFYTGSPDKIYTRFRISHPKDFSIGFTAEKDAGEKFHFSRNTKTYGMDYYSFHFMMQNKGRLKSLILGDYQLQIGQSLLLGAGFVVGKGAETVNTIRRSSLGIRPYTSIVESGFFRGVAATYSIGSFYITPFYSNTHQDGNVQATDSLEGNIPQASSIYTSGFHRTTKELAMKNLINEQVAGGNVQYRSTNKRFETGLTLISTRYNAHLQKAFRKYNQFEFAGIDNYIYGFNTSYSWQNFNFFGEGAISKSGGKGIVSGFVASLSPKVELSMLIRSFDRNFHSFYGRAFGENARNINERGNFFGIKIQPFQKVTFSAFYDRFYFPWLKFKVDAPSNGYELLVRLNYSPSKKILLYTQFRQKSKDENVADHHLNFLDQGLKRNYIINLDYQTKDILHFRSRIQSSSYTADNNTTYGFTILQDISLNFNKLSLSGRLALFDTDNFQNRQYVYEKDVLYAFSIPAYNGIGTRSYFLVQYKLNDHIQLWSRIARTRYFDRHFIGTGLERIEGNLKTEFKFQIRYRI